MGSFDNYECDGQIEITDYLKSMIISGRVKNLTAWINSQGKCQYDQIKDVVRSTYEREKDSAHLVDRITNAVSIYVLDMSDGYMKYLKDQSK